MCGITGYVNRNEPADRGLIEAMTRTLRHRGPDDMGAVCLETVAMGQQRLSIIDLSPAGHQPMCDENEEVWIVFNGEFYNFEEHRRDLQARGCPFASRTDTEVIIYLYREYGIEKTLEKMNGMFAFCLYDSRSGKLYIARDRLGIKPCYYALRDDLFVWGSEAKSVIRHPGVGGSIRGEGIKEYFSYSYIPDPHTIFEGVYKMRPAEYLEFDTTSFTVEKKIYWDVDFEPDGDRSEEEWLEELDSLLRESVRRRLISDVPFGAFLSGGIDSTVVVSYMSQIMTESVKTFSVGFEEREYSELPWARQVAAKYGTDHHERTVLPDAVDLLPKLCVHFDEPFADPSAVPTYYVSKLARENVTVVLSGDGGDENFAGYTKYDVTQRLFNMRKSLPAWTRNRLMQRLASIYPENARGRALLDILLQKEENIYHTKMLFFAPRQIAQLLKPGIADDAATDAFGPYFERARGTDFMSSMQYIDLKTYLPMDILTKVDRSSMAVSLETRVPILDHTVVEHAARIPLGLQRNNGCTKYLLKRLLKTRFGFDDRFLERSKRGFDMPISRWFTGTLDAYAREHLLSADAMISHYLDQDYVRTIIEKHRRRAGIYANLIWSILVFEHWLRVWGTRS